MRTAILAIGLAACLGCGGPRVQTTRLQAADLVAMTDKMAASLARAEALSRRGPGSPTWWIAADRVVNKSNDIIPEREKELFIARLRALLNRSSLSGSRNLRFVREAALAGSGRPTPTHALTATFDALTHADPKRRTDYYLCAFQLIDLRDETVVWEDAYEVKRTVVRSKFD